MSRRLASSGASSSPNAASGAMYDALPTTKLHVAPLSRMRATPRSPTATRKLASMSRLDGFRSRWTVLAAWIASTPRQA